MIAARIAEDFFFLAPIPVDQARGLCPDGLEPAVVGDRAWLALATVSLERVRLFGLPVARRLINAAMLLVVDYAEPCGLQRRGNFFLRGFTTSHCLALFNGLCSLGLFSFSRISIRHNGVRVTVTIPGLFEACIEGGAQSCRPRIFEELFAGNRSGLLRIGGRVQQLRLLKTHWDLEPRVIQVVNQSIFEAHGARVVCCFDTSNSYGDWAFPRPVRGYDPRVSSSRDSDCR